MSKIRFDENEYVVMAMFETADRTHSAQAIAEVLPYIEDDEELTEIVRSTLDKMGQITDQEYRKLDLEPYRQELEDEDEG
ncbi:MAG: transposon-transfer assisting family protein [Clostridiales bacterium]|nr:transposon-transfer assisting family protein [Clostridiales bacterium]